MLEAAGFSAWAGTWRRSGRLPRDLRRPSRQLAAQPGRGARLGLAGRR